MLHNLVWCAHKFGEEKREKCAHHKRQINARSEIYTLFCWHQSPPPATAQTATTSCRVHNHIPLILHSFDTLITMADAEVALKSAEELHEKKPQEAVGIYSALIDSGMHSYDQHASF